jgi:hypothetical protein
MTDYHNLVTIDTPRVELDKLNIGPIYLNAVRCHTCGEVIRSKNRHDFVTCACGSISVDGGSWYLKRSGDLNNYTELSENFNE